MIICGFPGTVKSMMARHSNWVDLESTPFQKDWDKYARVAKHMSDNGYTVMTSTHRELLAKFEQMEVSYTVVIPSLHDEDIYRRRYEARGNSPEFIDYIVEHYRGWIREILNCRSALRTIVVLPSDGCIAGIEWDRETKA